MEVAQMLAPALTAHTDLHRHHVAVSVSGPLATADHARAVITACLPLPRTYGLMVNLSGVTIITDTGLAGLRELALSTTSTGHQIAFVCSELMLRAELVLSDLDTVAPVLEAEEQAFPLVGYAA
jgi:anti-anti-sigma regulatory factor